MNRSRDDIVRECIEKVKEKKRRERDLNRTVYQGTSSFKSSAT